jgi:hypothetical protein
MVRCSEGHAVDTGRMKTFGEVLAEARKRRGLTLKAVGTGFDGRWHADEPAIPERHRARP